jgi:hypothetical protein
MRVKIEQSGKKEIDIFRKGNYVVDRGFVVLITDARRADQTFTGVAIATDGIWSGGEVYTEWSKSLFTQFTGKITIEL